jgi:hypothetical protein
VLIDWTPDFDRWMQRIDQDGGRPATWLGTFFRALADLTQPPNEESPTFKVLQQARRYPLWRMAHPYDPDVALRIIVWFPSPENTVIALFGFNKARHGDVWYSRAAIEAEAAVDQWIRDHGDPRE